MQNQSGHWNFRWVISVYLKFFYFYSNLFLIFIGQKSLPRVQHLNFLEFPSYIYVKKNILVYIHQHCGTRFDTYSLRCAPGVGKYRLKQDSFWLAPHHGAVEPYGWAKKNKHMESRWYCHGGSECYLFLRQSTNIYQSFMSISLLFTPQCIYLPFSLLPFRHRLSMLANQFYIYSLIIFSLNWTLQGNQLKKLIASTH